MSDSTVLRRQSLASQVADAILTMILEGELGAEGTLPSTGDLAERFSVSIAVIREALADLAGRGVVERSQGRESVVSTPGPAQLQELFRIRVQHDSIEDTALIEFRQSIEVQAARLAASRRTDENIAELEAAFTALKAAKREGDFHEADIALHRSVAAASGNPLIVLTLDAMAELMRSVRRTSYRGRDRRKIGLGGVLKDHRAVVDAIIAEDPDAAAAAMQQHLDNTLKDLAAAR